MFAVWIIIGVLLFFTITNTLVILNLLKRGHNEAIRENTTDRPVGNVFQRYKGITDNSK